MDRPLDVSLRAARRIVVALVGLTLLLLGMALLVLPGPGLLVIGVGLAALSTEFVWARRWLASVKRAVAQNNPLRERSGASGKRKDGSD